MADAVVLEKQKRRRILASAVHLLPMTILTKRAEERFTLATPY